MDRIRIKKIVGVLILTVLIMGISVAYYVYNMPHRDVQKTKADYSLQGSAIVNEYLSDATSANEKYLDDEGESKVLEISGSIAKIDEDFEQNKVILLKSNEDKAGVSCTFLSDQKDIIEGLKIGDQIVVKGVIRSGASFDEDLDMFENVIVEKSTFISKK